MSGELLVFLSEVGRARFVWGERDCFLFVADWVERVTGRDPAGEFRGAYTSEREARNLIKAHGGPLAFADELLARAECEPTDAPQIGDIGLVRVPLALHGAKAIVVPVGAIKASETLWAIKSGGPASLTLCSPPVIRAWNVPRR